MTAVTRRQSLRTMRHVGDAEPTSTAKPEMSGKAPERPPRINDGEDLRTDIFKALHDAALESKSTEDRNRVVAAILRGFDDQDSILAGQAYVICHTVALCDIDIAGLLQEPGLASVWERIRVAASFSEERMNNKRKRRHEEMTSGKSTDEGRRKRRDYEPDIWRTFFAAAAIIGLDRMVHYGWVPRRGSGVGRAFLFDLERAARATQFWTVLTRRICAVQWVMFQDGVPFRTPKLNNGVCTVQQSHLKAIRNWEGGQYRRGAFLSADDDLTPEQIDKMGFEKDRYGLLQFKTKADVNAPRCEALNKPWQSKDGQDREHLRATDKTPHVDPNAAKTKRGDRSARATEKARAEAVAAKGATAKMAVGVPGAKLNRLRKISGHKLQQENKTSRNVKSPKNGRQDKRVEEVEEEEVDDENPLADLDAAIARLDSPDNDDCRDFEAERTGRGSAETGSATEGLLQAVALPTTRLTPTEVAHEVADSCSEDEGSGSRQNFIMPSLSELQSDFVGSRQKILATLRQLQTLGTPDDDGCHHAHYRIAMDWMTRVELPRVGDIHTLLHGSSDVDVVELSSEELIRLLNEGHTIDMPIILRGQLHQLSSKDIVQYIQEMKHCGEQVEVQRSGTGLTKTVKAQDGLSIIEEELADPSLYTATDAPMNLLNLRDLARAQQPVVLEHSRWRMLQMLERIATSDPGKQTIHRPSDITSGQAFNLLASTGSFSTTHADFAGMTWVRMLSEPGLKLWNTAVHMKAFDWDEFRRKGAAYIPPRGKAVTIPLTKGDLLIMPVGTPHAPLTISPSLMDGGEVLDKHRIIKTLRHWLLVSLHPSMTNEPVPQELPKILASLETLVTQDYKSFQGESGNAFQGEFWTVLGAFGLQVACNCKPRTGKACDISQCTCHQRGSRCTDLCGGHAKVEGRCKMETLVQ